MNGEIDDEQKDGQDGDTACGGAVSIQLIMLPHRRDVVVVYVLHRLHCCMHCREQLCRCNF
jgi:hypothetical protein